MPLPSRRVLVAVDGPSGSGKSSVSREVARRAGLAYLDTGAMYRAACWAALRDGVDVADPDSCGAVARAAVLDLSTDPDVERVAVDGEDVTAAIRGPEVTAAVSAFASHPPVREELRGRQRSVMDAALTGCIAEGRDITTVVAPDADVRVLLTADTQARVDRRTRQLADGADEAPGDGTRSTDAVVGERPAEATTDEDGAERSPERVVDVRASVVGRDAADSRVTSFLTAADGVTELDSSGMDMEQTVQTLLGLVLRAQGRHDVRVGPAS